MSIYGESDIKRVENAMRLISDLVGGTGHDDVKWGSGWLDVMKKIDPHRISKSCKEIKYGDIDRDKRVAAKAARVVNRGARFAYHLEGIEKDLGNLYPAADARLRLDEVLGWDTIEGEPFPTTLDRSMMKARVNSPDTLALRRIAYRKLRSEFTELDVMGESDE